uniref:NADH-ubiquinone oxidoreductase chain 6 n=1 Tax=Palaemon serenus TaxID=117983 RepID=A0A0U2DXZ7_9EUCA|nr:NADH dehydrogenase subunit 6 [Palaemon serenus]AKQ09493.1 NADH dehydrogenase subunit 6 [Palaemon serenus]
MSLLILLSMIMISVSLSFASMTHPLAMGLTLITQTILICVTSGLLSSLSWFSYILFLIFLGATLVLFIYVASLASNEIFKLTPVTTLILLTPFTALPLIFLVDALLIPNKEVLEASSLVFPQELASVQLKLNSMYGPTSAPLTAVIVLYLLLTLVVVVKLSSTYFGPLRMF